MKFDLPEFEEVRGGHGSAPRVSVIVPTFRSRNTLLSAVQSIATQTWRDFEIIVVDDACPERSTQVLETIHDTRLRIIRLSRNVGLSGARNAGISVGRGELIALLDADDICHPHRLQRQIAALDARPDVGLVSCLANRIDEQGNLISRGRDSWNVSESALKPLMLFANPLMATHLIRRSALPPHGFRPILAEDYGLVHDVLAAGHNIMQLREVLVDYRVSSSGIMHTKLDLVAAGACDVQRRALAQMGMPDSTYDKSFMRWLLHIGRCPPEIMSIEWLWRIRSFIDQVHEANRRTQTYDQQALNEAATRFWEVILYEAVRRGGIRLSQRSLPLFMTLFPSHATILRGRALAHSLANFVRPRLAPRRI